MDKKNKPTDQTYFHGSNKSTNGSYGYQGDYFCVFYFLLKCDPLKETPRKSEDYACQDVVRRLSKWDSIFKATYSLPQTFD